MLRSRPTASSQGGATNSAKMQTNRRKRLNPRNSQRGSSLRLISVITIFAIIVIISYRGYFLPEGSNVLSNPKRKSKNQKLRMKPAGSTIKRNPMRQGEHEVNHDLPSDSLYNLQFPSIDGDLISLSKFKGHAAVVINVASE